MINKFDTLIEEILQEKKDACYHKVKSKYKKSGAWPSYYAAGALAKCRKKAVKIGRLKKNMTFENYFYLKEALQFGKNEKGRGFIEIKAPEGYDVFSLKTLIEIFKDIKNNKEELLKFIKEKSHNFSPFVVLLSMVVMGINTQLFINQHPEILQKFPNIIQKVAEFLNQHPNILKFFQ